MTKPWYTTAPSMHWNDLIVHRQKLAQDELNLRLDEKFKRINDAVTQKIIDAEIGQHRKISLRKEETDKSKQFTIPAIAARCEIAEDTLIQALKNESTLSAAMITMLAKDLDIPEDLVKTAPKEPVALERTGRKQVAVSNYTPYNLTVQLGRLGDGNLCVQVRSDAWAKDFTSLRGTIIRYADTPDKIEEDVETVFLNEPK
jgi:transcriptional regulator with XRE-family HTH domain